MNLYEFYLLEWDKDFFIEYGYYLTENHFSRGRYNLNSFFPQNINYLETFIKNRYLFDDLTDLELFFKFMKKLFYKKTIHCFISVMEKSKRVKDVNIYKLDEILKRWCKSNKQTIEEIGRHEVVRKETADIFDFINAKEI